MSVLEQLRKIDESLISLLGERIRLIGQIDPGELVSYSVDNLPHLAEAGIPVSVWDALVKGCEASALNHIKTAAPSTSRQIVLIGGRGVMGSFFGQRLSRSGHQVRVLGSKDWDNAESVVKGADLVLLCVPLNKTVEIISRIVPYLSTNTVLADVASVKASVCDAMRASYEGPVVGLHPMFGPGATSLLGQKVIVCPVRELDTFQWFLDWIKSEGGHLIFCSPEEHDHMMVVIQAIRYFSTFCLGVFLTEEGVDTNRSLEFSTLIYRIEADMIERLFAQDAELYIEIMLASQDRLRAITRLSDTSKRLANLIQSEDRSGLLAEFLNARRTFNLESGRAMKESNFLIQSLNHYLAAELLNKSLQGE